MTPYDAAPIERPVEEEPAPRGPVLASKLLVFALLVAAVTLVARPWRPIGAYAGLDEASAIPVLMANTPPTPYHVYYWGQDRFGGWPYVAAHAATLAGFRWTPDALFFLQLGILLAGLAALAALAGAWAWLVVASALAAVAVHPDVAPAVLSLAHPYAFQIALLFAAWWALRKVVQQPGRTTPLKILGATVLAWMACSATPLAVPLLLLLGGLEAWRVALLARLDGEDAPRRSAVGRWGLTAVAVLLAVAVEIALRTLQHSYIRAHRLPVRWTDYGFAENPVENALAMLAPAGWTALALVLAAPALALVRRLPPLRRRATTEDEASFLSGAATLAGLFFASLVALAKWPQLNGHAARYLAPALVLLAVGAAAGLAALLQVLARPQRHGTIARLLACAVLLAAMAFRAAPVPSVRIDAPIRVAAALEKRAPGEPLVGPASLVTVVAALQGTKPSVPVVREGDFNRLAWTLPALDAPRVVRAEDSDEDEPFVFEHGRALELETPRWLVEGNWRFGVYRNVSAGGLPARVVAGDAERVLGRGPVPSLAIPAGHAGAEALRIELPEARSGAFRVRIAFAGAAPEWDADADGPDAGVVLLPAGRSLELRVRGAAVRTVRLRRTGAGGAVVVRGVLATP